MSIPTLKNPAAEEKAEGQKVLMLKTLAWMLRQQQFYQSLTIEGVVHESSINQNFLPILP